MAVERDVVINVETVGAEQGAKALAGYNKVLGGVVGTLEAFKVATLAATKSIGLMIRSLGALKVALIATGIGAIVIGLAAFNIALSRGKRLQDNLRISSAQLSAVIDSFADKVSNAVENLLGLNEALEEGERQTTFFDRVVGTTTAALAFLGIISAKTAAEIFIVSDQAARAEEKVIALEDSLRTFNLQQGRARLELELTIQATRDLNVTNQERIDLVRDAIGQFDRLAIAEEDRLNQRRTAIIEENNLAGASLSLFDAEQRLLEFDIEAANVRRGLSAQRRELLNRESEAFTKLSADIKATRDEFTKTADITVQKLVPALEKLDFALRKVSTTAVKGAETEAEAQEVKTEAFLNAGFQIAQLGTQLGLQNKELQIANSLINAAAAFINIFAAQPALPLPIKIAESIALTALLAGQLATIANTPIPTFGSGGFITGPSHSQGGTLINAEGGEYMISRDRMAIPAIREAAIALNNAAQSHGSHFQLGGFVPQENTLSSQFIQLQRALREQRVVLVTEDLDTVQQRVAVTEDRATL